MSHMMANGRKRSCSCRDFDEPKYQDKPLKLVKREYDNDDDDYNDDDEEDEVMIFMMIN